MEDSCSPASQNHNGQLAGGANVSLANNKHQGGSDNGSNGDAKDQRPQYSMPGILHFIQHEWARFELERSQWELDRAEFQVYIDSTQGIKMVSCGCNSDARQLFIFTYITYFSCHVIEESSKHQKIQAIVNFRIMQMFAIEYVSNFFFFCDLNT